MGLQNASQLVRIDFTFLLCNGNISRGRLMVYINVNLSSELIVQISALQEK